MMKYRMYSIRDEKTEFMAPQLDSNDESALRNFRHAINSSEGVLFSDRDDFSLYCIGEFETVTGHLKPFESIQLVCRGGDFPCT